MHQLVEAASYIAEAFGGRDEAVRIATAIASRGASALRPGGDDVTRAVERLLVNAGVIDPAGNPHHAECAQLVLICEVLRLAPQAQVPDPPEADLVFTAPTAVLGGLEPAQRLDLLVADVIRMSRNTVVIGGPYWNEAGFDRLLDVLTPAVADRAVTATFYLHTPEQNHFAEALGGWVAQVQPSSRVRVYWYEGPVASLMHAKFVLADRSRGYFGTANLTSLGFEHHVEVGVELTARQSGQLLDFLARLHDAGLFREALPGA